jgi:hypothetical protein
LVVRGMRGRYSYGFSHAIVLVGQIAEVKLFITLLNAWPLTAHAHD